MNDIIPRKHISISRNDGAVVRSILSSGGVQPSCSASGPPSPSMEENQLVTANDNNNSCNKVVRYKECLKNHAAAIGGNATDGCGEFTPNGEEGSLEALMCSACNCHRNFHRKEIECECPFDCYHSRVLTNGGRKFIVGLGLPQGQGQGYPMIMPYEGGPIRSETDKKDDGGGGGGGVSARPSGVKLKKRYRTKFSQEQKEKMLNFAEMAGWRIQRLDESVVNQFCQSIGIKRRVLKVWMHNNKQRLENKDHICS